MLTNGGKGGLTRKNRMYPSLLKFLLCLMSAARLSVAALINDEDLLAPSMAVAGTMVFAAGRLSDFTGQHIEKYGMLLLWSSITFLCISHLGILPAIISFTAMLGYVKLMFESPSAHTRHSVLLTVIGAGLIMAGLTSGISSRASCALLLLAMAIDAILLLSPTEQTDKHI